MRQLLAAVALGIVAGAAASGGLARGGFVSQLNSFRPVPRAPAPAPAAPPGPSAGPAVERAGGILDSGPAPPVTDEAVPAPGPARSPAEIPGLESMPSEAGPASSSAPEPALPGWAPGASEAQPVPMLSDEAPRLSPGPARTLLGRPEGRSAGSGSSATPLQLIPGPATRFLTPPPDQPPAHGLAGASPAPDSAQPQPPGSAP